MKKSEKLMSQIRKIQELLAQADVLQQNLFAGFETEGINSNQCYELHNQLENLIDDFDEIAYEYVMPIQADEDSRVIDLGSGMYDAREGDEDSFSNLGL